MRRKERDVGGSYAAEFPPGSTGGVRRFDHLKRCFVMAGFDPAIHVLLRNILRFADAAAIGGILDQRAAADAGVRAFAVDPAACAIGIGEGAATIGHERQFAQGVTEPFANFVGYAIAHVRMPSGPSARAAPPSALA